MSNFEEFFEAQYGSAPYPGSEAVLLREVADLAVRLDVAKTKLAAVTLYRERHTAALHAWQARERT